MSSESDGGCGAFVLEVGVPELVEGVIVNILTVVGVGVRRDPDTGGSKRVLMVRPVYDTSVAEGVHVVRWFFNTGGGHAKAGKVGTGVA